MKRHPALVPLSRDHHHALVVAKQLREATPQTAAATASSFLAHWEGEEREHFRREEELLLPAYAAHASPDHPVIVKMLLDHVLIRRDAERLALEPHRLELQHELGARLAAHVELEERELFPMLEGTLSEPELQRLGARLHAPPTP